MKTKFTLLRVERVLIVVVAAFLAGCQSLPGKLEQELTEAKALVSKCLAIDQAFSMPEPDQIGPQLKARLRLKLTGVACKPQAGAGAEDCGVNNQNLDLEPVTNALSAAIADLRQLGDALKVDTAALSTDLTAEVNAIEAARKQIDTQVKEILAAIRNLQPNNDEIAEACEKPRLACGRAVAGSLNGVTDVLRKQEKPFAKIAAAVGDLKAAVQSMDKKLAALAGVTAGKARDSADSIRAIIRRAEATFGEGEFTAGLILSADVQAIFDELYVHKLKYRSADRFITFSENEMTKFDKLVDKADDKLLMGGSFALWLWQDRIQSVFDKIVDSLAKEALDQLDFTLAFGRAGCDHLEKTPPPPAMFAPFLNRAIVKMASESLCAGDMDRQGCAIKKLEEMAAPEKACQGGACAFENQITTARRKTKPAMNDLMRFQTCQAAKIMAVSSSLVTGSLDNGADAAARACGGVVETIEREAGTPRPAELPTANSVATLDAAILMQILRAQAAYQPVPSQPANVTVTPAPVTIMPPSRSPPLPLSACQTLEQRVPGARCREPVAGTVELVIPGLYKEGEFLSEEAYASLSRLAEAMRELEGKFGAEVGGTTSSSLLSCARVMGRLEKARMFKRDVPNVDRPMRVEPVNTAGTYEVRVPKIRGQRAIGANCAENEQSNKFLAVLRAAAAADLLARSREQPFASITVLPEEAGSPAPFVAALDRGLVVKLTKK